MTPGAAAVPGALRPQKAAWDMESRAREQIFPMAPQPMKGDPLGMPHQPGCLVISVPGLFKVGTDP
jgi:hypothetical protein